VSAGKLAVVSAGRESVASHTATFILKWRSRRYCAPLAKKWEALDRAFSGFATPHTKITS
jgi:hypothetical protein